MSTYYLLSYRRNGKVYYSSARSLAAPHREEEGGEPVHVIPATPKPRRAKPVKVLCRTCGRKVLSPDGWRTAEHGKPGLGGRCGGSGCPGKSLRNSEAKS
jgi:hypothetical protein